MCSHRVCSPFITVHSDATLTLMHSHKHRQCMYKHMMYNRILSVYDYEIVSSPTAVSFYTVGQHSSQLTCTNNRAILLCYRLFSFTHFSFPNLPINHVIITSELFFNSMLLTSRKCAVLVMLEIFLCVWLKHLDFLSGVE